MCGVIYDCYGVFLVISMLIMKVVIDLCDYFDNKKLFDEIIVELVKDLYNCKLKC